MGAGSDFAEKTRVDSDHIFGWSSISPKTMDGHVDSITENLITGWAHNPARPEQRVQAQIFIGGNPVGSASAEHFRADLLAAGIGDGRKAFHFDPRRFITSEDMAVRVVFAATGEVLSNGEGVLSRSRISNHDDWDRLHDRGPELPVVDRLGRFPEEQWPLISILIPVVDAPPGLLVRAIDSVRNQVYSRWELCIADASPSGLAEFASLQQLATSDARIRIAPASGSAAEGAMTNAAFSLAQGAYTVLLDGADELTADALAEVALALLEHPESDAVYGDHDLRDEAGEHYETYFKPGWSPVHQLGVQYLDRPLVIRTSLLRKIGGSDGGFGAIHDHDLTLRLAEATDRVRQIPKILYHRRVPPAAAGPASDPSIDRTQRQVTAVQAHLDSRNLCVRAVAHPSLPNRVQLLPAEGAPTARVSIIILTRDAPQHIGPCLESIFGRTTHQDYEVIVVDNGTTDPVALAILGSHPIRWIKSDLPFNFSRMNNQAARAATGEVLVFLNNDTEVKTPDWLQIMLAHLQLPGVGAVGPLMVYPYGTVQHAGIVLGFRGTADHVMGGFDPTDDGYHGSLSCSREVSAVTGACLMLRRDLFTEIGGMDEAYRLLYQDVDLCLTIRKRGMSVVYVANAVLIHHQSATRGPSYDQDDRELFLSRWSRELAQGDPYYHPNFTRNRTDYTLR